MIRNLLIEAVEAIREGLVITDHTTPGQPIIFANRRFLRMTGYTEPEIIGRNCRFLQADDRDQPARQIIADAISKGVPASARLRNYTKDGRLFWNDLSISPLENGEGQITNYVGVIADATVAQMATEQRALIEQRAQHRQRVEALGTLAGGIAHDVGNTLVPITSLSQVLASQFPQGSEQQEMANKIYLAGQRIADLVNQIRIFSRRETLAPVALDLASEVQQTLSLFRSGLPDELVLAIQIEDYPVIVAERSRLHQVIMNLLTNAMHATAEVAGPHILVRIEQLRVSEREPSLGAGPYAHLIVADNGHGMDVETQARALDPFFTTKGPEEGSGMGLAIVHSIVSTAGGIVRLESKLRQGTTVHVFWPALEPG